MIEVADRQPTAETPRAPRLLRRGVTPRAVLVGLLSIVLGTLLNACVAYSAFRIPAWGISEGALPAGPIMAVLLLLLVNTLLLRVAPRHAFSRSELLVIYGLLIVSVCTTFLGSPSLVSFIAFPYDMATSENGWASLIWPHIPSWLSLTDPGVAMWYREGAPSGYGVPWGAWLRPLFTVSAVYFALMAAMLCLASLVSRDWMDRQRLAFPVAEVPLALIGEEESPSLRRGLWSSAVFWIGFAIPALLAVFRLLHALYPNVPEMNIRALPAPGQWFQGMGLPWRVLNDFTIGLAWQGIGLACLVPTEVSLSLWLFYLLYRVQLLLWASAGVVSGGASAGFDPAAFIGFQEAGGVIALGAVLLYQSRKAFVSAWRSLVHGGEYPDHDAYAPLASRWALLGFLLANGFLLWRLVSSGGAAWYFAGGLAVFYAYCLVISRLIASGGVWYAAPAVLLPDLALHTIGGAAIGARALTLGTYADGMFLREMYTYDAPMAQAFSGIKLLRGSHTSGRRFALWSLVGVAVMLAVALPALLVLIHKVGAGTMDIWFFYQYPRNLFGQLDTELRHPTTPDSVLRLGMVLGAAVVTGLVYLNAHFLWWPLSPIGFIVASTWATGNLIWANAFVGWLVNTIIRHTGGLRLYRTLRPAFIGLVAGDIVGIGGATFVGILLGARVS